jgi:glyoxylase-like metal-dependent hydrolase (beta-lactamase superfamily II)
MNAERYAFKVGNFGCLVISDFTDVSPLNDFIVNVSAEQVEQALADLGLPTAEIIVDFNCLLVNTGQQRVLVDTGLGQRPSKLRQRLQAEGISPQDIETIIITHGDLDHIGGVLDEQGQPAFPNARYVMWQAAWDFWTTEANLAKMSEESAAFGRKTLPLIQDRIDRVEPETEFLPGFRMMPAVGHRRDHLAVLISSAGEQLLHLADTVGHPVMMTFPGWYTRYDSFPEEALATKRRLLDWAAAEKVLIFGAHLPFPGLGHVSPQGEGWRWQPLAAK